MGPTGSTVLGDMLISIPRKVIDTGSISLNHITPIMRIWDIFSIDDLVGSGHSDVFFHRLLRFGNT